MSFRIGAIGAAVFIVLLGGVGCSSHPTTDSTAKSAFYGSSPTPDQLAAQRNKIMANQEQWAKNNQPHSTVPGGSAPTPPPN